MVSRSLGETIVVFASQEARSESTEDGTIRWSKHQQSRDHANKDNVPSVPLVAPERLELDLELLALEHGVLGLLGNRADEIEAPSDFDGLLDLHWSGISTNQCEVERGKTYWQSTLRYLNR